MLPGLVELLAVITGWSWRRLEAVPWMNLHYCCIYYWLLQLSSQLLSRFDHQSRICGKRIFKGIYFSQFLHTVWWRIPAKQISMKLHHWCISTMKIAVTLARSEKQSFSCYHGPVLATQDDQKGDLFQGLASCALGSPHGLSCLSHWVGERCPCVLSVQWHITCLPEFSWGNLHFPWPFQPVMKQPICQAFCRFGAEVFVCFMKMFCQLPLVSAEVSRVPYLHGQ